ncbi:MAG: hypothetical protein K0U52_07145 [Gammaproteobacteria bacterium]|nr:hypothetical protein [Gammaproteobacteria bacterium]
MSSRPCSSCDPMSQGFSCIAPNTNACWSMENGQCPPGTQACIQDQCTQLDFPEWDPHSADCICIQGSCMGDASCLHGQCVCGPGYSYVPGQGCQDVSTRYSCHNFQCVEDPQGPYATQNECIQNCVKPMSTFACANSQCQLSPTGKYSSVSACMEACQPPQYWACSKPGVCVSTSQVTPFSTQDACQQSGLCQHVEPQGTCAGHSAVTIPCASGEICSQGKCVACSPQCQGKNCGSDGCGGSCGTCKQGSCIDGNCCVASCVNKKCGDDDGCGGKCTGCPSGQLCNVQTGQCTSTTPVQSWFTQDVFDTIFPYAVASTIWTHDSKPFWTYEDLIAAISWLNQHPNAEYHGFASSNGDHSINVLELAAFLANAQQEVGANELTVPGACSSSGSSCAAYKGPCDVVGDSCEGPCGQVCTDFGTWKGCACKDDAAPVKWEGNDAYCPGFAPGPGPAGDAAGGLVQLYEGALSGPNFPVNGKCPSGSPFKLSAAAAKEAGCDTICNGWILDPTKAGFDQPSFGLGGGSEPFTFAGCTATYPKSCKTNDDCGGSNTCKDDVCYNATGAVIPGAVSPGRACASGSGMLYGSDSKATQNVDVAWNQLTPLTGSQLQTCPLHQAGAHCRCPSDQLSCQYGGRGAIQLSYDFNYNDCSLALFGDYRLALWPNLISATDRDDPTNYPYLCNAGNQDMCTKSFGLPGLPQDIKQSTPSARQMAWLTCLWFWMSRDRSGFNYSCHDAMQEPSTLGITCVNSIINGQYGCTAGQWAAEKNEYFKRVCKILGVGWQGNIVCPQKNCVKQK